MKIFNIYWWKNIFRETKWFIQRGKRGWSDQDVWGVDWYLSDILPPMLKKLKNDMHSIPGWQKDEPEEVAQERWDKYFDDILFAWESQQKICQGDWFYFTGKDKIKAEKYFKNKSEYYVMTKEECERYRKGMKFFIKYLNCLWD